MAVAALLTSRTEELRQASRESTTGDEPDASSVRVFPGWALRRALPTEGLGLQDGIDLTVQLVS